MDETNVVDWLRERLNEDDLNEVSEFLTGYFADAASVRDGAAAKTDEYEKARAALMEQISTLKAKNYDLLISGAGAADDEGDQGDPDEDEEQITISDLFEDKED